MLYRHTDKPVRPVSAVAAVHRVRSVQMFLVTAVARSRFAQARAYYRRRLRQYAKAEAERDASEP